MKKTLILLLLMAAPVAAQLRDKVRVLTVAQLPATCTAARIYNVIDGSTVTDCTTGGGANAVWCECDSGGSTYTGIDPSASGGGGGAPTDVDYLVGTADATLSAEIVVGTTPGGELGGTWATPTVDSTHSGSAHHSATTDTGPSPDCSGTSTYQDGDGGCDAVGGDLSGALNVAVVGDDSHAHTTTTLSGIAVGDLANGTDGELITWDAAAAPAVVAAGTSGQVLTSNGAGTAPTFQAAAGGGISNVVEDTTPQLGGMLDVNGFSLGDGALELFKFTETPSAVNEFTIANAATGGRPTISATGDDANIDLSLQAKGSGVLVVPAVIEASLVDANTYIQFAGGDVFRLYVGGIPAITVSEIGNVTTTTIWGASPGPDEALIIFGTASDVNETTMNGAPTGSGPTIAATGDDTNIDLNLTGKGSGSVSIANILTITPQATAPATCSIGDFYVDTSGAACACSATNTWSNMHATGTCV